MSQPVEVIPGAEPWSSPGRGEAARTGVVVLHGLSGNPISVRPLAEALAEQGWTIEVPRLPGHGTTWRDMADTRYLDWRGEAERAVDGLRGRCDDVVLVGLSMGGTLALDVATKRQDLVRGVATINAPLLDREGVLARLAPILQHVVPVLPAAVAGVVENDIAKPGGDEHAYTHIPSKAANSFLAECPRVRAQIADLTCPLLVMYSPQDHTVPCENSLAIKQFAGSEDVTEIVLERSYHVATLDWDAELIADATREFTARVTA